MYRWVPWGKGKPPYKFVFVAMEPTSKYDPSELYPQPGAFNEPLRFAIERFMFKPGEPVSYLITNMAKCSIKTGHACNHTRELRYKNCARFLRTEVANAGSSSRVISIGKVPKESLEKDQDRYGLVLNGKPIPWVWHYGFFNTARFQKFARENESAYSKFRDQYVCEYEKFLCADRSVERANQFNQRPNGDLSRIFNYSCQMGKILDCHDWF